MAENTSENQVQADANGAVALPSFFGVKAGMTRIFDNEGNQVPVTVVKLISNYIAQVKTQDKDGYEAYQVAYYEKRPKLVNKPMQGHLAKASIEKSLVRLSEVKVAEAISSENLGKEVSLDLFNKDTIVDITGISKGKGFQGVMKKFNFRGGPAAHGSHFHRRPGSIGNRATPARVFAEKKMPGHMGMEKTTVQNLKVVELNLKDGYMLIKGSVPGAKNGFLRISTAIKKAQ